MPLSIKDIATATPAFDSSAGATAPGIAGALNYLQDQRKLAQGDRQLDIQQQNTNIAFSKEERAQAKEALKQKFLEAYNTKGLAAAEQIDPERAIELAYKKDRNTAEKVAHMIEKPYHAIKLFKGGFKASAIQYYNEGLPESEKIVDAVEVSPGVIQAKKIDGSVETLTEADALNIAQTAQNKLKSLLLDKKQANTREYIGLREASDKRLAEFKHGLKMEELSVKQESKKSGGVKLRAGEYIDANGMPKKISTLLQQYKAVKGEAAADDISTILDALDGKTPPKKSEPLDDYIDFIERVEGHSVVQQLFPNYAKEVDPLAPPPAIEEMFKRRMMEEQQAKQQAGTAPRPLTDYLK